MARGLRGCPSILQLVIDDHRTGNSPMWLINADDSHSARFAIPVKKDGSQMRSHGAAWKDNEGNAIGIADIAVRDTGWRVDEIEALLGGILGGSEALIFHNGGDG